MIISSSTFISRQQEHLKFRLKLTFQTKAECQTFCSLKFVIYLKFISKEIIKEFCYLPAYKVGKRPSKWAAVVSYSQKLLFWNGWWRHALSTIVDPEGVIIQICWQNLWTITVHTEPLSRFPSSCFMITSWMNALEISGKKKIAYFLQSYSKWENSYTLRH